MSKDNEIKKYTSKKEEKIPTSKINGISYDRFMKVFIKSFGNWTFRMDL